MKRRKDARQSTNIEDDREGQMTRAELMLRGSNTILSKDITRIGSTPGTDAENRTTNMMRGNVNDPTEGLRQALRVMKKRWDKQRVTTLMSD